jgi:D-glutamate cyclase
MTYRRLTDIRDLIQEDIGDRGLATDSVDNLLTAFPDDFVAACKSLAATERARLVVVTGFYIAHAEPPCAETDGPLGAVFLARALVGLGMHVAFATDGHCALPLQCGLASCGLSGQVPVFQGVEAIPACLHFAPTHLVALERVGPSHHSASILEQPGNTTADLVEFENFVAAAARDRCYSMRGRDLSAFTAPLHHLFEVAAISWPRITTLGIGDGGNELGMGKIRWDTIRRNIANGGLIACRVPTDHLIVCGVSNWGAYGLAAGVRLLRNAPHDPELFNVEHERELLEIMVRDGPLVDGKSGKRTATVDGLSFDRYAAVLPRLEQIVCSK